MFVAIIVKFVRKNSVNDNIIIVYGKRMKTATLSVECAKKSRDVKIFVRHVFDQNMKGIR